MKYSITEKLKFAEDPQIEIQNNVITVKSDAETLLELMDAVHEATELDMAKAVNEKLFSEKDRKVIKSLHLKMDDYLTLMTTAIRLAMGEDPEAEASQEG